LVKRTHAQHLPLENGAFVGYPRNSAASVICVTGGTVQNALAIGPAAQSRAVAATARQKAHSRPTPLSASSGPYERLAGCGTPMLALTDVLRRVTDANRKSRKRQIVRDASPTQLGAQPGRSARRRLKRRGRTTTPAHPRRARRKLLDHAAASYAAAPDLTRDALSEPKVRPVGRDVLLRGQARPLPTAVEPRHVSPSQLRAWGDGYSATSAHSP
jgi:hypothetical protein